MKQKIDRLAGAIVLGFHIYCDVILGAVLAVVGAAGFYHSFFIRIMREPVAAVGYGEVLSTVGIWRADSCGDCHGFAGNSKNKVNRGSAPTGQVLDNSVQALERGIIILLSIAVFYCLDGAPGIYSYCDPVYGVQHVIYIHEGWLETRDLRCDCSCGRHSVFLPVPEVRVC